MDIANQLRRLASELEPFDQVAGVRGPETASMLRNAAQQISSLQSNLANIPPARFDRFFTAALQGILAHNSGAHLMSNPTHLVSEARRIATLCVQAQPGEDS